MSSNDTITQADLPDIDVWCAFFDQIHDDALLNEYRSLLSADERQRLSRFAFLRDRHRYLVTRALVRSVLSRYARVTPREWVFSETCFGRPQIANQHRQAHELSFNISHTNSLIVLGVARRLAIGVDTENVTARAAPIGIGERLFAAEESAALQALPESSRQRRFFEYWTLKEAYLKARSFGLSVPLDQCSFRFVDAGHIAMSLHPDVDCGSAWHLWQFSIGHDHVVAICAEGTTPRAPRLVVREIVPLHAEHGLAIENLQTSHAAAAANAPARVAEVATEGGLRARPWSG